jgi:hypothetical protein
MDSVIISDTVALTGPAYAYREFGFIPKGTIVHSIEKRDGWLRLESGMGSEQCWIEEALTLPVSNGVSINKQLQHSYSKPEKNPPPRPTRGQVTWSWAPRAAGIFQIVGGVLEVTLGVGGVAVPEPATTVGGVILIAHGTDTIIAGFRTLWSGQVTHSLTQTGATIAAEEFGASPETARRIGIGADVVAGIGPSVAFSVTRRLAIAGAEQASHKVAVAYLHRSAMQMGHNAVGVKTGSTTAWVHFAGVPQGAVQAMGKGPNARYIITELMVNGQQAARAVKSQQSLISAGVQTWRYFGPNCTTTALHVLRQGGTVVPAWSMSPGLLHLGVKVGGEVTFMAGTVGTMAPDLLPEVHDGGY